ncbi:molybdopterin synthase [Halorubrum sp. DTA98]|uniref:molybdopterin synthase n=1 Tax=Halorubrum sp. DTA98 TaxID=3402163 RepID=UPI003AB0F681
MQPISILGPGATTLADVLAERVDGRVAVVVRDEGTDDGGFPVATDDRVDGAGGDDTDAGGSADPDPVHGDTTLALASDGSWHGRGTVGGFDDLLDRLAPDHDYLVAVDYGRLRVPTVLLGDDLDPDEVPGTVVATATEPSDVDVDTLLADLADAEPWIPLEKLVERIRTDPGSERSGAIATFTGRVRAKDGPDDDRTTHLAFEKYEGVARERMDDISAELTDRDGVFAVRMHHRTGVIEAGEDIVFVVVLAGHRDEAFRTVKDGIDRLKDEVPIFKKETTDAEEFWVHHRE